MIQAQIDALLAQAEPLRLLPPDEAEEAGLQEIVAAINALRHEQQMQAVREFFDEMEMDEPVEVRRRPGRPRKANA